MTGKVFLLFYAHGRPKKNARMGNRSAGAEKWFYHEFITNNSLQKKIAYDKMKTVGDGGWITASSNLKL